MLSSMATVDTTREAVAAAALAEFASFGYRRTSIESIARRAGVSRATVYAHWSSKDELFHALVTSLHEEHLAAMHAVATDPTHDVETRLCLLLQARFLRFVELTSSSASAAELYDRHSRLCGDVAQDAQRRAEKIIATVLRRAVAAGELDLAPCGLTVTQLAGVLDDCAYGAKGEDPATATPAEFRTRVTHSVRVITCGIRPDVEHPRTRPATRSPNG